MGTLLRQAVQLLEERLGRTARVGRFSCEESTVHFNVEKDDGSTVKIGVCYADAASYPVSTCWFLTDTNNVEQDQLQGLSEKYFQERAPLGEVLAKVLNVLGIDPEIAASLELAPSDEIMDDQPCQYESMDQGDSDNVGDASDDGSYEEDDDDHSQDDDDDEDREMMIECGQRQGRWERWEERCREALATDDAVLGGLSHDEACAKRQQIFKPREAFMMLSRELLDLIKKESVDMFVDSVGDDVYTWAVELASFDPHGNLHKDMQEMQRRHQFSFVKLVISFKRGLHPFYPPSIEVVRPHFQGCTAAAVASHPLLKLGSWDPWKPVGELISQIKVFLESVARVDLDHAMNDIKRFPASSYRPLEVHLARLNALSGLDLPCEDDPLLKDLYANFSHDQARLEALASDSSNKRLRDAKQKETKTIWAQGTGYGTGERSSADPVWDAAASEIAQRARDEELRMLLESLATDISLDLQLPLGEVSLSDALLDGPSVASTADITSISSRTSLSTVPWWLREVQEVPPDMTACLVILTSSCLAAFLVRELKVASFTDMCSRTPYYLAVLGLAKVLGRLKEGCVLLWQKVQGNSVAGLLHAMLQSAQQYTRVTQPVYSKDVEDQRQAAAIVAAAVAAGAPPPVQLPPKVAALQQETMMELREGLRLAARVQEVVALLPAGQPLRDLNEAGSSGSFSYCEVLRPLQVEYIPDLRSASHAYASPASSESLQPKSRLAREMAGLQQLLPLNECSSIFVRSDENNVTLWRALITGPEDTPYSTGCFVFDLYFPPNYPLVPPQVLLKTTGGGRIRFNPNLYNNGKVCLSLLGTWEGGRGEGWNPSASSALQVLLSIQSLILVPDPYFNEPGFEQRHNSEEGKRMSQDYNKDIVEGTIQYAMIDLLKHPPKELENVIKAHFKLRKEVVLNTTQAWIKAAEKWNTSHASKLKVLRDQLVPLLDAL